MFGAAGIVGYLVDVSLTSLFEPIVGVYFARIPAFISAATATWVINRSFTFSARKPHHKSLKSEYLHYLSLMVGGALVNYMVYVVTVTYLRGSSFDIYIAVALGSLAGMMLNYLTSRRYIYKA